MQKTSVLTLSLTAAAAISAARFVTAAGAIPAAGKHAIGVTTTEATAGELVAADVLGTTIIEAGGVITANKAVQSDASGKAVTRTTGVALGIALEAASADGDRIEIFLVSSAPDNT